MMKSRQESSPQSGSRAEPRASSAWSFVLVAGLVACGAGSSLDEYAEGVPDVVPSPIKVSDDDAGDDEDDAGTQNDGGSRNDGGARDGGTDAGRNDGGGQQGGQEGGQGGAAIGSACTKTEECTAGGNCLTNVNLQIVQLDFPKGYCSKMGCMSDGDCPSGSGCLGLTSTCLKTCTNNTQCRSADGYQCSAPPLGGLQGGGNAQYCLPTGLIGGGGTMGSTPLGGLGGLLGGLGGTGALGGLLGGLGGTAGGR
jgi:hypothetical protein